jgi:hypothetical protein
MFLMDKEGTDFMQMLESFENSVAIPTAPPAESAADPMAEAAHMRALRRKARRVSAYARWSVTALNALAGQVESDIAALQH